MKTLFPNRVRKPFHQWIVVGGGILALAIPIYISWGWSHLIEPVELWTVDVRFTLRPPIDVAHLPGQPESARLVEIDYDDKAARELGLGRWPWDRRIHAQIVGWLNSGGAQSVILDLLFEFPSRDQEEDSALAEAILKAENVILPVVGDVFDPKSKTPPSAKSSPFVGTQEEILDSKHLPQISHTTLPFPPLNKTAAQLGHIHRTTDVDGVLRRVPLLYTTEYGVIPALSLATVFHYFKVDLHTLEILPGQTIRFQAPELGDVAIPIDEQGRTWINFTGRWGTHFLHFPYSWLRQQLDPQNPLPQLKAWFQDRAVVVANLTTGSTDQGPTPFEKDFPFGELHLHLLNMIMTKQFLRDATPGEMALCILGPITLLTVLSLVVTPISMLIGGGLLLIAHLFVTQWAFTQGGILLPVIQPTLTIIIGMLLLMAIRFFIVDRERWRFQSILGSCLPPQTVQIIKESPERIPTLLAGHRRELTILFSDIQGFSTYCATADPTKIQKILNDYLNALTFLIRDHGGTLDKYMGDGIMAFFGDAEPEGGGSYAEEERVSRHAGNAVRAGIAMQQKMTELNAEWQQQDLGHHPIRIGINTGTVTLGNMGTDYLWDYTVIGHQVNTAQRLEQESETGGLLLAYRTYTLAVCEGVLPPNLPDKEVTLKGIGVLSRVYMISPEFLLAFPGFRGQVS